MGAGPERSLFPEGSDESVAAAHATQGAPCSLAELPIICRTNIRKFVLLPVAPDVFHRIQFGSVGGKILDLDSAVELVDIVAHETAAVGRQTVPDQKQRLANVLHERLQKIDDLRTLYRTSVQPEIETQEREYSNRRQTLPVEIELEDGGLPAGRPRATPMRPLAQSAFVDEDDRAPFSARFFLIAGHFFLFQLRISSSLRSRARPVGRCGLQLSSSLGTTT